MSAELRTQTFQSPSRGPMSFVEVVADVAGYVAAETGLRHRVVVGTDSQNREGAVDFVSVVVVHRQGRGGRYYWRRFRNGKKFHQLRDKIYEEALSSLTLAQEFTAALKAQLFPSVAYDFEIHVDVGENGPTREMIKEVVGMIRGSGFAVKIKPEGYGAFVVADKHT